MRWWGFLLFLPTCGEGDPEGVEGYLAYFPYFFPFLRHIGNTYRIFASSTLRRLYYAVIFLHGLKTVLQCNRVDWYDN